MNPTPENCCAIIVTYHPDHDFFSRLHTLSGVCNSLVVIDNGSPAPFQQHLLSKQTPSLSIMLNAENLGLAAALNQGVAFALQQGFRWVMTFDQDTLVYPEILQVLSTLYQQADPKPMLLGSNYWHSALNRPFLSTKGSSGCIERKTLITSGTLLALTVPLHIGYFREDYFIDSIDHEYCLRARQQGYRIVMSKQLLMRHEIGTKTNNHRLRWLRIPEHTALRKYYMTRNCLTTAANYATREPRWALRQLVRLAIECLAIVCYEPHKAQKLGAIGLGCWHAMTGQLGKLNIDTRAWLQ